MPSEFGIYESAKKGSISLHKWIKNFILLQLRWQR